MRQTQDAEEASSSRDITLLRAITGKWRGTTPLELRPEGALVLGKGAKGNGTGTFLVRDGNLLVRWPNGNDSAFRVELRDGQMAWYDVAPDGSRRTAPVHTFER